MGKPNIASYIIHQIDFAAKLVKAINGKYYEGLHSLTDEREHVAPIKC